ncbi:MAG: UDP-N-acetylmuramate dehydrogenase [Vicinamibacterales bacterium]|jgi:UDP-N-acetylmuramate dehydrogenase|nr:UDP-N-acetylenolpyruvoylglucosamine reductase [Acidobacteriota bacterium]MDP6373973.1 UDP-N-acetylmuramate dehydrogenase [Vicinamibacterales bacterium]MDP6609449.1 UDP-N-acetylmuramate dehydrogenase [Vicinamibacterales bacterium]HAK56626.1 UDP-N-acetylenolpyruvoylglucosamine reductase [Acidobacteriota bacterium]|tara:strand:+ start:562 stop:1506 length:945 start_codon:yes stop_codon:yes gene_type:complete
MADTDRTLQVLEAGLGAGRVGRSVPLAPKTTFRVGGAAEWFVEARTSDEVARAVRASGAAGLSLTILGGGSNVVIGDRGVRGLVVQVHGGAVRRTRPGAVRADGGVSVNGLVRWTITRALAGLECWAGTPGTVGGAVYGNAHFDRRLIGDLITSVGVVDKSGALKEIAADAMEFGYDRSRLQRTAEVLLWAEFAVAPGEPGALRAEARRSLAYRKRTQPLGAASAGCIFRNPDPAHDTLPPGVAPSAGALIDAAGLKDRVVGGARVSTTHGNFIVNAGEATAADIRALVTICQRTVAERYGVELRPEIVYLGEF